jgi:hypothetical protein
MDPLQAKPMGKCPKKQGGKKYKSNNILEAHAISSYL